MSLNVIGLVSGGKDSLFSLAHCIQNGHKLIALANLHPNSTLTSSPHTEGDEGADLDSFMYQTVGHSIVPLYGEALGVPLYRRPITGTAVQNGRYYETGSKIEMADETEDMYTLIKEIVGRHPQINALSAGAILSTYQRTRVESVAVRLGLVPLAYLWQYPALPPPVIRKDSLTGLLDDMELSGCDARIIKIASGGMHTNMSFSNVADPLTKAKLVSGMTPFFIDAQQELWLRGSVLGEGGEYETLALDGPGILWRKRIHIDDYETYEAEGGAIYVRLGKTSLVGRHAEQSNDVPIPALLDQRFAAVLFKVLALTMTNVSSQNRATNLLPNLASIDQPEMSLNWNKSSRTLQIFNLTSPGDTAADQLDSIIMTLPAVFSNVARLYEVNKSSFGAETLVSATLLLQSMEDFIPVNQVYTTKLWPQGMSNPPARVTIAASLPRAAKVSISLVYDIADGASTPRKGLHVQSRSYWGPANIGPYSQAICVPVFRNSMVEITHLAGQIPLAPATMIMLEAPFIDQAVLALQHLWRVAQERGVDQWAGAGIAFLSYTRTDAKDDVMMLQRVRDAARIWRLSHRIDEKGHDAHVDNSSMEAGAYLDEDEENDEDEDIDVWDLQQRYQGFGTTAQKMTVGEHLHKLPHNRANANAALHSNSPVEMPCFIAVEVLGLPRDAPIEWWSTGIAGLVSNAGAQTTKLLAVQAMSTHLWTLSGMSIEGTDVGEVDNARPATTDFDRGEVQPSQRKSCFFVTLQIDSTINNDDIHLLPHTLKDLIPSLVQDQESRDSMSWELVTAHSFINLSCPAISNLQDKLQLLQNSCVILCNHVWSSEFGLSASAGENDDGVREVAAALVIRIDAFSK